MPPHTARQTRSSVHPRRRPGKRKRKSLAFRLVISFGITVLFTGAVTGAILYTLTTARFDPSQLLLGVTNPTIVYDRYGRVAFTIEPTGTRRVSLKQIPVNLQRALIATEDVRFYHNYGIDVRSLMRSLIADLTHHNRAEGGSTITEQLGKVVYLKDDKSLRYKLEEVMIALQINHHFSKNQILDMYFNTIDFNGETPGVENAAEIYFQRDVSQLDLAQCALLAGLPQGPTEYDPFLHPHAALVRRNTVLRQMAKYGFITQRLAAQTEAKPLELAKQEGLISDGVPPQYASYRDYLYEEANQLGIGQNALQAGGLRIYTELDPKLQLAAFEQFSNDKFFPPAMDGNMAQAGAVFLNPQSGGIEAIEGSRPSLYEYGGFDYATETERSPGSSIKPLVVYGPALDSGRYTPDSLLYDGPLDINGYQPEDWEYHPTINQEVTVRDALAMSWNIPAVWLLNQIGIANGLDFAERAGLTFETPDFSHLDVSLGDIHPGTNPLQMADAYTSFDNNGQRVASHAMIRIMNDNGDTLYDAPDVSMYVMKSETANTMVGLLRNNVVNGIAQVASVEGQEIAGKTGSVAYLPPGADASLGDSDLWFCGFSPSVVGAIWEGFPDPGEHAYVPNSVGGSALPAELFSAIMTQGLAGRNGGTFESPVNASVTKEAVSSLDLVANYDPLLRGVRLSWKAADDPHAYYLVFRGLAGQQNLYYNRSLAKVTTFQYVDPLNQTGRFGYQVVAFDAATNAIVGESGIATANIARSTVPTLKGVDPSGIR